MVDINESRILYESFCAIAESYTSIVYVDAKDRKVYPIRLDDYSQRYEKAIAEGRDMTELLGMYVSDTVYREDAEGLLKYGDYDFVQEKLKTENPLFYTYRAIHEDKILYYRLKIVTIEDGQKIVYGFENFDGQFRLQMKMNAEREMRMMLVDGLSREYMSVWYLDGKSRKVKLIQNNGSEKENAAPVKIGETVIDYHFSMQKYYGSYVDPEDFDRMMRETSYETLVENTTEDDLYSINYIRINPDKTRSHFQVCYAKITDDAGIANFVFGYRNIDNALNE
ncbi:MAG: hypothetical protein K6G67_03550 [Lachnospiraceae bacterium]|nr:hypothetical protein [Lachnospiraceae bacterium]